MESYYHSHFCAFTLHKKATIPIVIPLVGHTSEPLPIQTIRCCQCVIYRGWHSFVPILSSPIPSSSLLGSESCF
jgi:hypothetical protein